MKKVFYILVNFAFFVFNLFEFARGSGVGHDSLWRAAEHILHAEIDRLNTIFLLKHEAVVAGGFAHYIERSTLAVGNLLDEFDVLFFYHHTHAFLRFVAHDFL